jgi:hypothetical protein
VIRSSTEALSFVKYASFYEAEPRRRPGWMAGIASGIASLRCPLLAVASLVIGLFLGAILI